MDKFQSKLRLLIVTGSAVGFIGGWGLLARAGKPATGGDTAIDVVNDPAPVVVPTLPPIDFRALESGRGSSNPNLQLVPDTQSAPQSAPMFRPRFRTRTS